MKLISLYFLVLSAVCVARCPANQGIRDEVENGIVRTLEKPRYAWRTVFERHWIREGRGTRKESRAAYLYRGETDTLRHYAVVQTSVQTMLFMRQDSEEPALLVFHGKDAVARYENEWRTPREIIASSGSEIIQRWEDSGVAVHCTLSIPAPHRILPVICNYLSNFRAEEGALVADITPANLAGLMALRIIEPQPIMTPSPEKNSSSPRATGRTSPASQAERPRLEDSSRRPNEKYQTGAGTARFWIREGELDKYELELSPTLRFSNGELEFQGDKKITITTGFREDPKTVDVPAEAVRMLENI